MQEQAGLGEFRAECVRAERRPTHSLKVGEEAEPHRLLEILAIASFFLKTAGRIFPVICEQYKYYIKCRVKKRSNLLLLPHFLHHQVKSHLVQTSSSGSLRRRGSAQHITD